MYCIKKTTTFFTEIKEPKGAQQFSIFTRAPLAPFWLLRLLNFRRPCNNRRFGKSMQGKAASKGQNQR